MLEFPDKKYKCILADPPWSYNNKKTGRDMKHGAESKYPTMSLEDICNIDVQKISKKDCCLFGSRGKLKAFRSQKPNIISERSTLHSRKPTQMYELIDSVILDSKIELFARERRDGWDSWGNEIE